MTMAPLLLSFRDQQRLRFAARGIAPVPVRLVDVSTTMRESDAILIVDATAGAVTVTLPAAQAMEGRIVTVKKVDNANNVTVDGNSAETIDGMASVVLGTQYDVLMLVSDGAAWHIL